MTRRYEIGQNNLERYRHRHLPIEGEEYDAKAACGVLHRLYWEHLSLKRFGHRFGYDHEVQSLAHIWSDAASRVRAVAERKVFLAKSSAQFRRSPSLA